MTSSDEEFDYMSDVFLNNCLKQDIRPGLIVDYSKQRDHDMLKRKLETDAKNKSLHQPKKVLEAEMRESGLSNPINSSNKGFALLEKMGFKSGSGLGKLGEGRTEPITISMKSDRQGLGRDAILKEVASMKAAIHVEMVKKWASTSEYRARVMGQVAEKHALADLRKSQRICQQLDAKEGYLNPAEFWFWPEAMNTDVETDASEFPKKEYFAGSRHVDVDDVDNETDSIIQESCSDDHYSNENGDNDEETEGVEEEREFEVSEKLEMLTLYLRRTHLYCVWCGTQYDDEKDLQQECPGTTRNDH